LPLLGDERLDVERRYQVLTGGPDVASRGQQGVGVLVNRPSGTWLKLGKTPSRRGEQAETLGDAVLVVRATALEELIRKLMAERPSEPAEAPPESHALDTQAAAESPQISYDFAEQDLGNSEGRQRAVTAFLACCNSAASVKIQKQHIWRAARYTTPRSFQYWKEMKGPPKETPTCDRVLRRILAMSTPDFLDLLRHQGHIPQE
jgi:hypothetical protein